MHCGASAWRSPTAVKVSEYAWRTGGAVTDGSTSFLELGSEVPVEDLIKGMIVQSGNDATIALAEKVGGSEVGLRADDEHLCASGWASRARTSPTAGAALQPITTARRATSRRLSSALIRNFPDYYKYYSMREFTWNKHTQQNRNGLLAPRSQRRRHQDRPHRKRDVLPGQLRQAQWHATDLGGAGLAHHQGARGCQRRAAQLRLHVLRNREAAAGRQGAAATARVQGRHRDRGRGQPARHQRHAAARPVGDAVQGSNHQRSADRTAGRAQPGGRIQGDASARTWSPASRWSR